MKPCIKFSLPCSFLLWLLPASTYALVIDTSVSAYVSHSVNDRSAEYYISEPSVEFVNGYPGDISTGSDDAGGGVNSRIIADAAGHNFVVSSARNGWIESYDSRPEIGGDSFKAYSFRNKTEVSRKAIITNDSHNDIALSFEYLINSGSMSYAVPDLLPDEYLAMLYSMDIMLNGQSIWFSGGALLTGERFTAPGEHEFNYVNGSVDLGGTESSGSRLSGVGYDTKVNYWQYSWNQLMGTMDLGVIKAGEKIELEYRYVTRVSGNIEHCVPQRDFEIPVIGCIDNVAVSKIGYGIWGSDDPVLFDHSTIRSYSVDEPSMGYLLLMSLFCLMINRRKPLVK